MSDNSPYTSRTAPRDHIDALNEIAALSLAGMATTDTPLELADKGGAQCALFEVIYRLACEGADIAEEKRNT